MSVPKLRFKEFKDEWKEKKLGDISTFSKGKGISKADIDENGKTPCIRYGELYTTYRETIRNIKSRTNIDVNSLVLSEINDVIIPASGETQLDIATASCVQVSGVALGGDLNIIKSKENGVFLSYYLNSKKKIDIAKLAQGNSVVHLYSTQLKLLNLKLPEKSEQTKIATFLSAVDDKIIQLNKKVELLETYKKGVMQKIFNQEIRFKNDNGEDFPDWEETTLEKKATFLHGGVLSKSDISENGKFDCIHYGELFTTYKEVIKYIISKTDLINTVKSEMGDILMPSSDVTPAGLAKACCILKAGVVLGGDINVVRGNSDIHPVFLSYLLNFENKKIIQLVTGTTVKHIYIKDLKKISLIIPKDINEQIKIGNFLTAIDEKINKTKAQFDIMKQYKKGLLQQMFV